MGLTIIGRFDEEFVQERMRWLQLWIDRLCQHPIIANSEVLQHFLTCTDIKVIILSVLFIKSIIHLCRMLIENNILFYFCQGSNMFYCTAVDIVIFSNCTRMKISIANPRKLHNYMCYLFNIKMVLWL